MTARTLREYSILNTRYSGQWMRSEWWQVFTPSTVACLIAEIDRLRVKVGEKPSYQSDGTLDEALRELTQGHGEFGVTKEIP